MIQFFVAIAKLTLNCFNWQVQMKLLFSVIIGVILGEAMEMGRSSHGNRDGKGREISDGGGKVIDWMITNECLKG